MELSTEDSAAIQENLYGKSLSQVMDEKVRPRVQSLACDEITKRSLDKNNAEAAAIMDAIQKKVDAYMKSVGITLDFIGWADTFEFDAPVQASINRKYVATQDLAVAQSLAPHTATLQALATAEGTRTIANKGTYILDSLTDTAPGGISA